MGTQTLEMRGMKRSAIVDYFISLDGNKLDEHNFEFGNWSVHIADQEMIKFRVIEVPSTKITFTGHSSALPCAIHDLRMQFLSAGG